MIPKDGLRQRLHVIRGSQLMHLRLDRDGFARGEPVVLQDSLGQIRFTLENRTADAHPTRLVLSGVPQGVYSVVLDGKTIASITCRELEEVSLEIPASGIKTQCPRDLKIQLNRFDYATFSFGSRAAAPVSLADDRQALNDPHPFNERLSFSTSAGALQ